MFWHGQFRFAGCTNDTRSEFVSTVCTIRTVNRLCCGHESPFYSPAFLSSYDIMIYIRHLLHSEFEITGVISRH